MQETKLDFVASILREVLFNEYKAAEGYYNYTLADRADEMIKCFRAQYKVCRTKNTGILYLDIR